MAAMGYGAREGGETREAGDQSSSARVSDKQHQEESQWHLKVDRPLPQLRGTQNSSPAGEHHSLLCTCQNREMKRPGITPHQERGCLEVTERKYVSRSKIGACRA